MAAAGVKVRAASWLNGSGRLVSCAARCAVLEALQRSIPTSSPAHHQRQERPQVAKGATQLLGQAGACEPLPLRSCSTPAAALPQQLAVAAGGVSGHLVLVLQKVRGCVGLNEPELQGWPSNTPRGANLEWTGWPCCSGVLLHCVSTLHYGFCVSAGVEDLKEKHNAAQPCWPPDGTGSNRSKVGVSSFWGTVAPQLHPVPFSVAIITPIVFIGAASRCPAAGAPLDEGPIVSHRTHKRLSAFPE